MLQPAFSRRRGAWRPSGGAPAAGQHGLGRLAARRLGPGAARAGALDPHAGAADAWVKPRVEPVVSTKRGTVFFSSALLSPFLRQGSPTKTDYSKKKKRYPNSNLSNLEDLVGVAQKEGPAHGVLLFCLLVSLSKPSKKGWTHPGVGFVLASLFKAVQKGVRDVPKWACHVLRAPFCWDCSVLWRRTLGCHSRIGTHVRAAASYVPGGLFMAR